MWRTTLLFFEEVVHCTLILELDVLMYYAAVSVAMIGFLALSRYYRGSPLTIDGSGPSTTSRSAAVTHQASMSGAGPGRVASGFLPRLP
ncbi:hypothetical protein P3102_21690 [Amycolatopsis sp. QT-25]|uniref:hypothetical protein n=1 Tax=Amycolatopsis sp. QT-25 TaxID=3034022 RepID=UPI0023EDF398|nr:hypothetical protein [Amycolatopsis sp. QT-25]WET76723.1 hypothetical protein P3102_21690 [Amycolatopsis sp. QT-25]